MKTETELEILEASYWEHFKVAKDLALYLPLKHPKREKIEREINEMTRRIHELKAKLKNELQTDT